MEDKKSTENTEEASLAAGSKVKQQKTVPSSITVNVPSRKEFSVESAGERRTIPKGLFIVLVTMSALLVVGVIVVGVLLITQPNATAAVGPAPAEAESIAPSATPSATQTPEPTATPTPTVTPVPTTAPEETDDYSSIFEVPTNDILKETQSQ